MSASPGSDSDRIERYRRQGNLEGGALVQQDTDDRPELEAALYAARYDPGPGSAWMISHPDDLHFCAAGTRRAFAPIEHQRV
jgi:hypothetical protein